MKNNLVDLNNHLFAQIERLSDEELTEDELKKEIDRSKAITSISNQIISNASLVLEAEKLRSDCRVQNMPIMLEEKIMPKGIYIHYPEWLENYLKVMCKYLGDKELVERLNNRLNTSYTVSQIANYRKRHNVYTGRKGYFKKGHKSFNKGLKWDDYLTKEQQEKAKTTCFKKGSIPPNRVELGTERIIKDGYIAVKVCDGKGNKNFVPKQRLIYEKHFGKIPPKHKVCFKDGNIYNFDIDNLMLVSDKELLFFNSRYRNTGVKEITETMYNIIKLEMATKEKEK